MRDQKKTFLQKCTHILSRNINVALDDSSIQAYADNLSVPKYIPDWKDYVSPDANIESAFFDLALNAAQNGGYYYREGGETKKWEEDGSGAKALVSLFNKLRAAGSLPYLNSRGNLEALENEISGLPFSSDRMAIFEEFSDPEKHRQLKEIFQDAIKNDDAYHFTFESIMGLMKLFPKGFGDDPLAKKAFLLPIIFAGYAHSKGTKVSMDTMIPADYRVPQTLHNIGILRLSDNLVKKIENREMFEEDDEDIQAIRAACIIAVDKIQTLRPDLELHHIDGELWFAGRKPEALDEFWGKIGAQSPFEQEGFTTRTRNPMCVSTLRF